MLKIEVTGTLVERDLWTDKDTGSLMWVLYIEDHTAIDTGSNIPGMYIEVPEDYITLDMSAWEVGAFVGIEVTCMRLVTFPDAPPDAAILMGRFVRFIDLP